VFSPGVADMWISQRKFAKFAQENYSNLFYWYSKKSFAFSYFT